MLKLLSIAAVFTLAVSAVAQDAKPLPKLDDMQWRGAYYQIARLPNKREKNCVANSVEMIARADKLYQISMVDSCKSGKSSYADVHNTKAKRQNKKVEDGRFKIATIWPLSRKYWVLATAPDYAWFLAGTPNHKQLWIYAKTATLDDATLVQIKALATANGYNLAKIVSQPQDATVAQGTAVAGQ
jgi:apolipoprotein D and lipocalin family protein